MGNVLSWWSFLGENTVSLKLSRIISIYVHLLKNDNDYTIWFNL